MIIYYMIMC